MMNMTDRMKERMMTVYRVWAGAVLMLAATLGVHAQGSVTLTLVDEPLTDALRLVEEQGGKSIIFSVSETERYRVNTEMQGVAQEEAIRRVLRNMPFASKERKEYFVVQKLTGKDATMGVGGRVVDEKGDPIANCNVLLFTLDSVYTGGTTTDGKGCFSISLKRDEEYRLQVSYIGYKTVSRPCGVGDVGTVVMHPDLMHLSEVNVTGVRAEEDSVAAESAERRAVETDRRVAVNEVVPSINIVGVSKNKKSLALGALGNVVREKAYGLQIAGLSNHVGDMGGGVAIAGLTNTSGGSYYGVQIGGLWNSASADSKGIMVCGLCNMIGGDYDGLQVGGLSNRAKEMRGIQVGGLGNISRGMMGLQVGGLGNLSRDAYGVQLAGLVNISHDACGFQIAGLANTSRDAYGLQLAGLMNISHDMYGLQFAGLANVSHDMYGLQLGGLMNVAADVYGLQFAGLVNVAKRARGVQFASILNIAEESDFPIGLVNIVKHGDKGVALSYDALGNMVVSFRSGGRYSYGILGVGCNLRGGMYRVVSEAGYGIQIPVCHWLDVNNEVKVTVQGFSVNRRPHSYSYLLAPSVTLWEHCNLFGGPSINFWMSDAAFAEGLMPRKTLWDKANGRGVVQCLYVGYQVGLQYVF